MTELYWITRLNAINGVLVFILIASFIFAVVFFALWKEDEKRWCKKAFISSTSVFCISLLAFILTPTEKQAYMIYGVGGTIDYLKTNETAKQLPDKCIEALDKVMDNYIEKNN